MEKEIVAGAIFILAFISPTPTPKATTSQTIKIEETKIYAVIEGDSLTSISKEQFGSADYWTNLWNANPWIDDYNTIEKDWKLKIPEKTVEPEELDKYLSEKLAKITTIYSPAQPPAVTAQPEAKHVITGTTGPLNDGQINFLGNCESGMSEGRNNGNGYYGAFQFSESTWRSMGTGYERADLAPLGVQIDAVQRLVTRSSIFTQFPGCSARMRAADLL